MIKIESDDPLELAMFLQALNPKILKEQLYEKIEHLPDNEPMSYFNLSAESDV